MGISTEAGNALVRSASEHSIAELDSIIFDMDGVLIDVSESIQLVHGATAERYFAMMGWTNCEGLVTPADVDAIKLAGGFNNDWDAAAAWLLLYLFNSERYGLTDGGILRTERPTIEEFTGELAGRGGHLESAVAVIREMCRPQEWTAIESRWDREGLVRLFVEVYSGDLCPEVYGFEPQTVKGPGLIHKDRAILDAERVPRSVKLGIATGRTAGEARTGLRLMGLGELFPPQAVVTEDDGVWKPDPRILALAVERLGATHPMYVGDTPDDLLTVRRYRETHGGMLSCIVLTGLMRDSGYLLEQQVDLIADNVNAALAVIDRCMRGELCPTDERK